LHDFGTGIPVKLRFSKITFFKNYIFQKIHFSEITIFYIMMCPSIVCIYFSQNENLKREAIRRQTSPQIQTPYNDPFYHYQSSGGPHGNFTNEVLIYIYIYIYTIQYVTNSLMTLKEETNEIVLHQPV
jgi:hypothetical protein